MTNQGPDWDRLAAEADESVGAELSRLQALNAAARLGNIVIIYEWTNRKGVVYDHYYKPKNKGIEALGLMEFAKRLILDGYSNYDGPNSFDEAEEADDD